MKKTIEQKVSDVILEKSSKIKIKDREFEVAAPTLATLIRISDLISTLPKVEMDKNDYISESLKIAKDCSVISEIVATMIVGVDTPKARFYQKPIIEELSEFISKKCTLVELKELIVQLILMMEIPPFFAFTTSLIEINLIKRTREVD
jgi:hypothetical protein